MKHHLFLGSTLLLAVLVVSGCTTTPLLNFSIISTKSLSPEALGSLDRGSNRAVGETYQQTYLIFPVGALDVQATIDRAIESQPGCVAIADGTIRRESRIFFPFIYADSKIVVEGTPLFDMSR